MNLLFVVRKHCGAATETNNKRCCEDKAADVKMKNSFHDYSPFVFRNWNETVERSEKITPLPKG